MTENIRPRQDPRVLRAWQEVTADCGCPDLYYCPASDAIECPRHAGFDVCCNRTSEHITAR